MMSKRKKRLFECMLLLASILLVMIGMYRRSRKSSYMLGRWYFEYVVSSDYSVNKAFWQAHDALEYDFYDDGVLIISGGGEPLPPTEYYYRTKDSVLQIFGCEYTSSAREYKVLSVRPDTIRLEHANDSIEYFLIKHTSQ